jgi:hypothetical protein
VQVSSEPAAADEHPSVTADSSGALHVAWDARPLKSSGVDPVVRAARSDDAGGTWSASVPVGEVAGAMSHRPDLALDPDGTVRAVWYDTRSADWRWQVATATLGAGGWSPARLVTSAGNSTWPALADGVVVFTSDRSARRVQRDLTQEVHALALAAPLPVSAAPGTAPGIAPPRQAAPPGRRLPATGGGPAPALVLLVATALAVGATLRRRGRP